jgi:hypothetical protein
MTECREYAACVDCYWFAAYGEFVDGCPDHLQTAVIAGFDALPNRGLGASPGETLDEFSLVLRAYCEICGSGAAGARYGVMIF